MPQNHKPAEATTIGELIVELTAAGVECNFRAGPNGRDLVVGLSIDGRDILQRFDRALIHAYRNNCDPDRLPVDRYILSDLQRLADRLLGRPPFNPEA
jgi:hypothetical protein